MLGSTTSFCRWSAEVQPSVARPLDHLLAYLREVNTPSRLIMFLVATVFRYVALQGSRPNSAHGASAADCYWTNVARLYRHPRKECDVKAQMELPKAFSVREENEFYPIQHLMARLNPRLVVTRAGTGVHVNGGCSVFWGVVHLEGQSLSRKEADAALAEAGFDFGRNVLSQASELWTG